MVAPSSESKIPQKRLDPPMFPAAATDKRKLHLFCLSGAGAGR